MKNTIIALFLLCSLVFVSQAQFTEYTFSSGDTTFTASVKDARAVHFTIRDSSITGTDSIYIGLKTVYNGITFLSTVSLHLLETTTTTTFVASNLVIPGDNTTKTYVWYPGNNSSAIPFTGSFFIRRLNVNDNSTPYVPKTRIVVQGF